MFKQNQQSNDEQQQQIQQIKQSKIEKMYEWCKNQFSRIFGCRKYFEDDTSDDDDNSDPNKFLENE